MVLTDNYKTQKEYQAINAVPRLVGAFEKIDY